MSDRRGVRLALAVYQIVGGLSGIAGAATVMTAAPEAALSANVEAVATTFVFGLALLIAGVALMRETSVGWGAKLSVLLEAAQVPTLAVPGVLEYWMYTPLQLAAVWKDGGVRFLIAIGGGLQYAIGAETDTTFLIGVNIIAGIAAVAAFRLWSAVPDTPRAPAGSVPG